ncbi:MAG: Crp/Fnr family transcriptional regulator [Gammaproteobacteria bacterium]|nr:Crp/Fnr family transcriptional regulator [Gammaproteobacteria bacterium]
MKTVSGLADISGQAWDEALAASRVLRFPAGMRLTARQVPSDSFVIQLSGRVRVYTTAEDGREICLYRVWPGQPCLLTTSRLLAVDNWVAQGLVEEDTAVLFIPAEQFERLLAGSASFNRYLLARMSSTFVEMLELVAEVGFRRLDVRLVHHLRRLAQQMVSDTLKLTHQQVADELGTTREVVSRLLENLRRQGHIELKRGQVRLLERQADGPGASIGRLIGNLTAFLVAAVTGLWLGGGWAVDAAMF